MTNMFSLATAAAAALLLFSATACAGGTTSAPPPTPPTVDFSAVPDSASIRPVMVASKKHPAHAHLLLGNTKVVAGERAKIVLHLTQDKGWHTY